MTDEELILQWKKINGCDNKRSYDTLEHATSNKFKYMRRHSHIGEPYKCSWCGKYHLSVKKGKRSQGRWAK